MSLIERAEEFFGKNENVDKVYFTSDGNMFRAEHYATNWAQALGDKKITPVSRAVALPIQKQEGDKQNDAENPQEDVADIERTELIKRYIELFDTKPATNIKLETLKARIAEKEATGTN